MKISTPKFDLSLIVPVLNEAEGIERFLMGLAAQQGLAFQAILCDGGSTDGTVQIISDLTGNVPFELLLVQTKKGRAQQVNEGAAKATGEYLLFLHADSSFSDPSALSTAVAFFRETVQRSGDEKVAARFSLCFQERAKGKPFFYYFAESKARLDRSGCTHGDQGFLVSRRLFAASGPFDQSCLVMEDTRFAETVRSLGAWVLLPVEIFTSVRRFEVEGMAERQILNMILMALDAVGREDFIREMPGIYATQSITGKLRLCPFLDRLRRLIKCLPYLARMKFWYFIGQYVSKNAWQIPFFLDVRKNYRNAVPVGKGKTPYLRFFGRTCEPLFQTRVLAFLAAGLTCLSFNGVLFLARKRDW